MRVDECAYCAGAVGGGCIAGACSACAVGGECVDGACGRAGAVRALWCACGLKAFNCVPGGGVNIC